MTAAFECSPAGKRLSSCFSGCGRTWRTVGAEGWSTARCSYTAGALLLILGVPDTVVDSIMGWEPGQSARMRRRYQHLTNRVLKDTADKVGGLLWTRPDQQPPAA